MQTPTQTRKIAGITIHLKTLSAGDRLPIADVGEAALSAAEKIGNDAAAIAADKHLSTVGKEAKMAPLQVNAVAAITALAVAVDTEDKALDQREAKLLAVPQLDNHHTAAAAVDVEIRQWWRSLSTTERAAMLSKFNEGPEHRRVEIALLRSPIALLDLEIKSIREGWNLGARNENLAETLAIESGRRAALWAREAVLHAAAGVKAALGPGGATLLQTIVNGNSIMQDGAWAFGFYPETVAEAKRIASLKKVAYA